MGMTTDLSFFPPDYASSRRRFRDAAARLGCALEAHPVNQTGPDGEALTIDVAIVPGARQDRALVVSSGIHGVEGFFGAAVQHRVLEDWAARPDSKRPGVRCVMVHALNPFGFAWRRRVDEDNIDLNRNLLLEGEPFRGSPVGYARFDAILNPPRGPSRWEPVRLKVLATIARYGMPALKQSVAAGQYDFPKGLFYGGGDPARMNEILSRHFDRWLGGSERVFHLDLHTGLGRSGSYKLLIDHPIDEAQRDWMSARFGADAFELATASGVAYLTSGSLGRWAWSRRGARDYLYSAAEFGTYAAPRVLTALRAENQCHHWGRPDDAATEQVKQELVEVFCPRAESWRAQVLEQGMRLVEQAAAGLA